MTPTSDRPLDGQAAVVTGAARGIGLAIAERLAADGAALVMADLDATGVAAAADQLAADVGRPGAVLGLGADCSVRADVERVIADCLDRFGRLDVFVANAGIGVQVPVLETSDDIWERTMAINLRGVFLGVQLAGGRALPSAPFEASLVSGASRHFLVYDNYDVLLAYNCAHAYALSVAMLAERIG